MKRILIILPLVTLLALAASGQANLGRDSVRKANEPVVTARFIPDSIAIGDHFRLRLEVTKDLMQPVGFPIGDADSTGRPMMTQYIEILEDLPVDTVRVDGRRITIAKEWKLTSFQAGTQWIKKIPVLWADKNIMDTVYARPDSIILQIGTFEIDTTTMTIYDIKLPMAAELRFGEFSGYLFGGLLLAAMIWAGIWMLLRMRREKTGLWKRRYEPPHLAAIRALEALHHQKLWQNNKHKQYYTLLADIVRTYIEGHFGVSAMEMTTDELLQAMREVELEEKNRAQLASLLGTADLAKFAKYTPPAEDNEACYDDAYYFVEDTKPAVVEEDEENGEEGQ